MAIYHLTAKLVKRAEGRNAVASAPYRSGSKLYEAATGITHDYSAADGAGAGGATQQCAGPHQDTGREDRQGPGVAAGWAGGRLGVMNRNG